jgi:hypothetical protein
MDSGVAIDHARSVVVIPAHVGIQSALRLWIPAYAVMTFPLGLHCASMPIVELQHA